MTRRRRCTVVLAVLSTIVASSACAGSDSDAARSSSSSSAPVPTLPASRLIVLTMTDHRFEPAALTARAGETITLRFVNNGTKRHEAVIGDEAVQAAHAAEMAAMASTTVPTASTTASPTASPAAAPAAAPAAPAIGSLTGVRTHPGMNAPNVVSVEAGATGEVTYSLAKPAHLVIGCHEVGHYEAGMYATLDVA